MKPKKNRTGIIIGVSIVALLFLGVYLNRGMSFSTAPAANFADAKPTGGKGLALLLNKIGYQSKVQDAPLRQMPTDAAAWLLLDPDVSFTKREGRLLLDWVKAGGTFWFTAPNAVAFWAFSPPMTTANRRSTASKR